MGAAARYATLQWLMFQMSAVGPTMGNLMRFSFPPAPPAANYGLSRFISLARRVYDTLNDHLATTRYLAEEEYTIADIATYAWTRLAPRLLGSLYPVLAEGWDGFSHLDRWSAEIAARPAVARALAQADSRRYTRDEASAAELDRLFERGASMRSLFQ